MKTIFKLYLLITACFCRLSAVAQRGENVLGRWTDHKHEVQIAIEKKGSQYFGSIIWLKKPNDQYGKALTDVKNIRPEQRERGILNLEILKNFTCHGNILTGGTIYDPRRGKNFDAEIKVNGNQLIISAMMGMFEAGSETWTKIGR